MREFYQLNLGRLPAAFHEAESSNPVVGFLERFVLAFCKLIRQRSTPHDAEPQVVSLEDFRISVGDLPPEIPDSVKVIGPDVAALGFEVSQPVLYRFSDPGGSGHVMFRLVFRHATGPAIARIDIRSHMDKITVRSVSFLTPLTDGTWIATRNGAPEPYPENWEAFAEKGLAVADTWKVHTDAAARHRNQLPATVASAGEVAEQFHQAVAAYMREQKYWEPWSGQAASLKKRTEPVPASVPANHLPPPVPGQHAPQPEPVASPEVPSALGNPETFDGSLDDIPGYEFQEVAEQVEVLDNGGISWRQAIVLSFLIMAILAPGILREGGISLSVIGILVGVIFFHELGHYLAMKLFGYRNVRMLIIPMVGGAVLGRNRDAAAWKKVIVSLAGPLPGILVGCVLTPIALALDHALLLEVSMWLLIVNGLNLLPILPLDGGHIVHEILFKRSTTLEIISVVAGAFGMAIFGSLLFSPRIAIVLAIAIAVGIPAIYRNGKVTRMLTGFIHPDPDPATPGMDPATLRSILQGIKAVWPKALAPKLYALHAVDVYERTCSKAPKAFASILFLSIHGASFLVAVIAGFTVLFFHSMGGTDQALTIIEAAEAEDWEQVEELLPAEMNLEEFKEGWESDELLGLDLGELGAMEDSADFEVTPAKLGTHNLEDGLAISDPDRELTRDPEEPLNE